MSATQILPSKVGTIISWSEDNDAGSDVQVFAVRLNAEEWRVNGFDIETEHRMLISIGERRWVELIPKQTIARAHGTSR